MKKTRFFAVFLILTMLFNLVSCGENMDTSASAQTAENTQAEQKILKLAVDFSYSSLDPHKEYYGWLTSIYGITETLFRMEDDGSTEPMLAQMGELSEDGLTWTITLKDGVCFSNGNPVTAEMVVRNLYRAAEVNSRFAYIGEYEITAIDDKILTIVTSEVYPTMLNDLASAELAIIDLDNTSDPDSAPIATGPFVIKSFEPEDKAEVVKNENYWNGEVKLDGAIFYYMQDDESKLMAMQNGEIDGYTGVTAAAKEVYEMDSDSYKLTEVSTSRLQFYILNENTMDDSLREAVNLAIDCEKIAEYLNGTVTPAIGPFRTSAAYGKVENPESNAEKAKLLLEENGYVLNSEGIYEKDGIPVCLNLCYYAARSLDSIALLMQEQLKSIGIDVTLACAEDPDSTYIASGDFDIALYCMISDKNGDPYYFIDSTLRSSAYFNVGGFDDQECESLINQLQYEVDSEVRTELANKIIQTAIDDNAFGYIGLFNKITVSRPEVSGIFENSPFDFYLIDADTDIEG